MARPITWQNVNAPSNSDAVNLFRGATVGIDNAFDRIGSVLKQQEAVQAGNVAAMEASAKNAYLDELSAANTPEALAQKQAFLADMRANLPASARAAVRGADEARLASLRQQTLAGNEYQDKVLDRSQEGRVRELQMLALTNPQEAAAQAAADPSLRAGLKILQDADARQQQLVARDRAATQFGFTQAGEQRAGERHSQDILESNARMQQARLAAEAAAANARQTAASKSIDAATKAIDLLGKGGGVGGGQSGDRAGNVDTLLKNLVPDEDTRAKMASKIAPLLGNPLYKGLSDRELVSIAMQTKDTRGMFASALGIGKSPDSVEALADAIVKTPDYASRLAQAETVDSMRQSLARSLYAGAGGSPVPTSNAPTAIAPSTGTVPTPTEASAAARNTSTPPVVDKPVAEIQALRNALPEYKGKPVTNDTVFDSTGKGISGFFDSVSKNSQRNNAQSTALEIKTRLDNGSYIDPATLSRAQEAAKKYPDQFEPTVLDWLTRTQATPKKAK